jgi:hypothetical protein
LERSLEEATPLLENLYEFRDDRIIFTLSLESHMVAREDASGFGANNSASEPLVVVLRGHTDLISKAERDLMFSGRLEVLDDCATGNYMSVSEIDILKENAETDKGKETHEKGSLNRQVLRTNSCACSDAPRHD